MKERLVHVWDRLDRAEQHFKAIKRHLRAYYRTCTNGIVGEFNPNTHFRISPGLVAPDIRMHTLVGEFLHDMRSALDHVAWQMVAENGGTPDDNTTFPILRTAPTANKKGITPPSRVAGGISADASALIDDAQPYHFGTAYANHPLYILHELWNVDKHRHIVARGSRLDEFVIVDGTPYFTFTLGVKSVTEDGAKIRLIPDDSAVHVNAQTTMRIMIHEPTKGIVDAPLSGALKDIREAVLTVVMHAEDRCF